MDDFEDFEITNDDLTQIENIEISLLNSSFQLSSESEEEYDLQPPLRKRRRRVLSISDTSDIELENAVPSTSFLNYPVSTFHSRHHSYTSLIHQSSSNIHRVRLPANSNNSNIVF
ncbi:unnamed protein product [Colias eurytheme]|nr:unnamed protein product [Colias eurytheme]